MKPRKSLAKDIATTPDLGKTDLAEIYGRRLSKLEICCHVFLTLQTSLAERHFPENLKKYYLRYFADAKTLLSIEFLEAILKRDGNSLRSLADFVEKWTCFKEPKDDQYFNILVLKKLCEIDRRKMTIKQVAAYLNRRYGKKYPEQTADGNSALRRLCKKMKFPIARDTRGPQKARSD